MVLASQFVSDKNAKAKKGDAAYLTASLDFLAAPTAQNKAVLSQACIEHKPGRADTLNAYFAKHGIATDAPQITVAHDAPTATTVTSAAKKPGSLM